MEIVYRLCMPFRGTQIPSREFEALAEAFGTEWRKGSPEVWSPTFTKEEAVIVLSDKLGLDGEEAERRFKKLIRRKNIIGVYRPSPSRTEVTIGEDAVLD